MEAALKMAIDMAEKAMARPTTSVTNPASISLLKYIENFWQPDSEYVREKMLVEKKPLSYHYLLSQRQQVKLKMEPYPGFAGIKLNELTKLIIRQWKLWLAEQGYSGRSINGALLALRVPVKRAFGDDIIHNDPFAGIPRAAHKEKKRGILTPVEIKKLIETPIADPRSRLAVYLPLFCSMRMGEVRGLLWGDISDGIIHIQHNWQEIEAGKNCKMGSEGYVPMPRVVAALVNQVYAIAPLRGKNDFVMAYKPNQRPICREKLWEALRTELASIGITDEQRKERNIVYHSLRHNFVTAGKLAGLQNFEIMKLSRHKDEKMILRYSDHDEAIDVREIGARMEKILLPAPCAVAENGG
jgi:integrase